MGVPNMALSICEVKDPLILRKRRDDSHTQSHVKCIRLLSGVQVTSNLKCSRLIFLRSSVPYFNIHSKDELMENYWFSVKIEPLIHFSGLDLTEN